MRTKKSLSVFLSKLKVFSKPNWKLEQYPTESDIAADMIWNANIIGDLNNKIVADFGCGTGILGIGALIAGAKKVYFIDIDKSALEIAKKNIEFVKSIYEIESDIEFIQSNIEKINLKKVDIIIQNPPFGVKIEHADRKFLIKSFKTGKVIYSLHKIESKKFIEKISSDEGFKITNYFEYDFPLKRTMDYHKKKIQHIKVGCWRLQKIE